VSCSMMSLNFLSRQESLCARNTAAFAVNVSRVRISKLLLLLVCWAHLMVWCSHCPWVWNCGAFWIYLFELGLTPPPVGLNNHRQFIIFVTALVIGIISFDYLTWACECLLYISPAYSPIFLYQTSHRLRTALQRHPPASSPHLCAALQLLTCSSLLLPSGQPSSSSGPWCCSLRSSSKLLVK
jgi:hypothetical protein